MSRMQYTTDSDPLISGRGCSDKTLCKFHDTEMQNSLHESLMHRAWKPTEDTVFTKAVYSSLYCIVYWVLW